MTKRCRIWKRNQPPTTAMARSAAGVAAETWPAAAPSARSSMAAAAPTARRAGCRSRPARTADPARPRADSGARREAAAAAPSRSRRQYMCRSPRPAGSIGRRAGVPIRGREPAARANAHDPTTHLLLTLAASLVAGTAHAQFSRRDPATGEVYKIEVAYGWWRPEPTISVASEGLGIPPTLIDFETDLGIEKTARARVPARPAAGPQAQVQARLPADQLQGRRPHPQPRTIVFNGQSYNVGLPVNLDADFTTLKIGYEYDFVYKDRGYFGFVLDTKVTRARIDFDSPINDEFAEATAPIPTLGFAGRAYAARNVAVGGEMTFFKIPGGEDRDYDGLVLRLRLLRDRSTSTTTPASPAAGGSSTSTTRSRKTSARSTCAASTSSASCGSRAAAGRPRSAGSAPPALN